MLKSFYNLPNASRTKITARPEQIVCAPVTISLLKHWNTPVKTSPMPAQVVLRVNMFRP